MKISTLTKLSGLVSLNLLALANMWASGNTQAISSIDLKAGNNSADQLNTASLKSMESTWLRVHHICKAKNFNADPSTTVIQTASAKALEIFKSAGSTTV